MTPRVRHEWARRVAAEYGSAGIAAQVLAWCIQAGLPPQVLYAAHRVVHDELEHARLGHTVLVALGGADEPVLLDGASLAVTGGLPVVLVRNFCFGETLAVPVFDRMRRRTTHPLAREVLDQILEDEARHRAFGWEALDALLEADPGVRATVQAALPAIEASFVGYAAPPPAPPLSDEERACGLLDHAEYAELYARCREEELVPRLSRRGLALG